MASSRKQNAQRQHLAQLAASLIVERGIRDFKLAKHKAAESLGLNVRNSILPKNREIEDAVAEYQRLFGGADQAGQLRDMREAALDAMRLFADFTPRLVGDVLSGLAGAHATICLHVFTEQSESFDLFLQEHGIPFEIVDRRFRFGRDGYRFEPTFVFVAGDHRFEATLFGDTDIRQAPLSTVDGLPMQRASRAELAALVRQTEAENGPAPLAT